MSQKNKLALWSVLHSAATQTRRNPPVSTIVFHGDPNNGGQILEQSMRMMSTQKKVVRGQVPEGHAYTRTIHIGGSGRGILGVLECPRSWTGMVGRQPCGFLH